MVLATTITTARQQRLAGNGSTRRRFPVADWPVWPKALSVATAAAIAACASGGAWAEMAMPGGQLEGTASCALAFVPSKSLIQSGPAPLPAAGGAVYSGDELQVWRQRVKGLAAAERDPLQQAMAKDWARLRKQADDLPDGGEPPLQPSEDGRPRWTHGGQARDAAFVYRLTPDPDRLAAVRAHLLAQVAAVSNDFTTLCIRPLNGPPQDAWFQEAGWLLRHAVTYDLVRADLAAADRVRIDNWLRRNAYALAAQLDWGLAQALPGRLRGDMAQRIGAAAATGDARWMRKRFDTNGDCHVGDGDDAQSYPVWAYTRADGGPGPRLSVLSQYYNNRRSAAAAAIGVIGVQLGDGELVLRARRYFTEWLAYSVWPDGSEGEYARNGDYCIAGQGLIYGATNSQGMALLAWALARQGDRSLFDFSTRDGMFGSESAAGDPPKSLALVMGTLVGLRSGALDWYFNEPWRAHQDARPATRLGATRSRFMGGGLEADDFHELGMWIAEPYLGVRGLKPLLSSRLREPEGGSSAPRRVTGLGERTDTLNALPSVLLLLPVDAATQR